MLFLYLFLFRIYFGGYKIIGFSMVYDFLDYVKKNKFKYRFLKIWFI